MPTPRAQLQAGLPTELTLSPAQQRKLFEAMKLDKKVAGGQIKFVLARRIGQVEFGHDVPLKRRED